MELPRAILEEFLVPVQEYPNRVEMAQRSRPRGRPCKDAVGWHMLLPPPPMPPPPPPLPNYGISASALAMFAPSSPLLSVTAPTMPRSGEGRASIPAPVGEAVRSALATSTLVATRTRATPPAVPQKRSLSGFASDAEHEAFKQDRRKAQKRVQEYGRAVRDRSARARPAEQRQKKERAQLRAAATSAEKQRAARPQLLDVVRQMFQQFGWLSPEKIHSELGQYRRAPGTGELLASNPWRDQLPAEMFDDHGGHDHKLACAALQIVRSERRAAGLPVHTRKGHMSARERFQVGRQS